MPRILSNKLCHKSEIKFLVKTARDRGILAVSGSVSEENDRLGFIYHIVTEGDKIVEAWFDANGNAKFRVPDVDADNKPNEDDTEVG